MLLGHPIQISITGQMQAISVNGLSARPTETGEGVLVQVVLVTIGGFLSHLDPRVPSARRQTAVKGRERVGLERQCD